MISHGRVCAVWVAFAQNTTGTCRRATLTFTRSLGTHLRKGDACVHGVRLLVCEPKGEKEQAHANSSPARVLFRHLKPYAQEKNWYVFPLFILTAGAPRACSGSSACSSELKGPMRKPERLLNTIDLSSRFRLLAPGTLPLQSSSAHCKESTLNSKPHGLNPCLPRCAAGHFAASRLRPESVIEKAQDV